MPPARLGLVYSHAGLRRFLDVIGVARTSELFFTARNVPARRALEWGLVNEVVASEELDAFAVAYAATIAAHAPGSLTGNKRVMRELLAASGQLPEDVARELDAVRDAAFAGEDLAEGLRAFAERRPPRFTGR
jgi:enoyl-CoA hydratase/carnithine racemase